jgi:dihydrofolate reductase
MTAVFSALATSVDGYITGPGPSPAQPLGTGGAQLFDWYTNGDTPSTMFTGFRLSAASAEVFDAIAERTGAVVAGRKTYEDSNGWGGGSPHPSAPVFVLTHRQPAADSATSARQTFVTTGIEDAIAAAKRIAQTTGKDVALMGSGAVVAALRANLLDEVTLHQVPVLLGGGVAFFGGVISTVQLERISVVAAQGVTHLTFAVVR